MTIWMPELKMNLLPEKFSDLGPFARLWAFETELQRSERRWSASVKEYQEFYDAAFPRLDDILAYLDQYKVGEIPDEVLPLYHLALAFAEAAPHNELYECANQVPNSFTASRFVAEHGEQIDK